MTRISVQDFVAKYNGTSVDFDKKYGAQCVDLFNYYNSEVVGAPMIGTPVTMGARDLYEADQKARNENYKKLPANSAKQVGDVLVYGEPHGRAVEGGKLKFYGHVNIYIGDGKVIQQNAKWNQKTTVDPVFDGGLLGILRPLRFIGENSPAPAPAPASAGNKHKIAKGDTFWALEENRGWEHGTLQRLNPGLDPKKLSIGSEINVPGAPAAPQSPAETYYNIVSGDNFWDLEDAWQLPHGTLQRLNPDADALRLQVGQRIRRS